MSLVTDMLVFQLHDMTNMTENMTQGCKVLANWVRLYNTNLRLYIGLGFIIIGGVIGNIFNIIVFNRLNSKEPSSFTSILKSIAYVNLFSQLARVPYIVALDHFHKTVHDESFYHFNNAHNDSPYVNKITITLMFVFGLVQWLWYTMVMCLTLIICVWRWVAVIYPVKTKAWLNKKRTENVIKWSYIIALGVSLFECSMFFVGVYKGLDFKYWQLVLATLPLIFNVILTSFFIVIGYRVTVATIDLKKVHRRMATSIHFEDSSYRESMRTTMMALFIVYCLVAHNLLRDFLELTALSDLERNFEHDCYAPWLYVSQHLQTIGASSDFFIYYIFNYKSFRKEIYTVLRPPYGQF